MESKILDKQDKVGTVDIGSFPDSTISHIEAGVCVCVRERESERETDFAMSHIKAGMHERAGERERETTLQFHT